MFESLIGLGIIVGIILTWILLDRENIEFSGPILIRRTQKGVKILEKIALRFKKVWRGFGVISIPIGFFFLIFIFLQLFLSSYNIITHPGAPPGAGPLIPWKYKEGVGFKVPGTSLFIPMSYGLIGLGSVMIFHELAHGLVAKSENLSIESLAFALFLIIPGAGVELDDEELEKAEKKKKLEIFSAGPASNIILSFFSLLIISIILTYFVSHAGAVVLVNTTKNYPAENLTPGITIFEINNISASKFIEEQEISPGEEVKLKTDNGTFKFNTVTDPKNTKKGIIGIQTIKPPIFESPLQALFNFYLIGIVKEPWYNAGKITWILLNSFKWIMFLNFGVGAVNLLPLEPLDGGKMFKVLISPIKSEKKRKLITKAVFSLSLTLILFNIVGPYLF